MPLLSCAHGTWVVVSELALGPQNCVNCPGGALGWVPAEIHGLVHWFIDGRCRGAGRICKKYSRIGAGAVGVSAQELMLHS